MICTGANFQMTVSVQMHVTLVVVLCCVQGMEGDKAAALAMENPSRFVMKPQREGGGKRVPELCCHY